MPIHTGKRLLEPFELQKAFQDILDSQLEPIENEQKLAILTAGEREHWARIRLDHFSKGVNQTSRRAIERAAFIIVLDEEEVFYDPVSIKNK